MCKTPLEAQSGKTYAHILQSREYSRIMNARQYSFIELSKKTVVNVADGKELGNACDLIFNGCGTIGGLVVPGKKSFLKSLTSSDSIYIPWNRIIKIGQDAILVEIVSGGVLSLKSEESQNDEPYSPGQ